MCFCDLRAVSGKYPGIGPRVQYGHLALRYPRIIGRALCLILCSGISCLLLMLKWRY